MFKKHIVPIFVELKPTKELHKIFSSKKIYQISTMMM